MSPIIPRSDFCAKCFFQYCFDPANPPNGADVVGRKLKFVNPSPEGLTKLGDFFADHKFAFIGGAVALVVVIGALIGFL